MKTDRPNPETNLELLFRKALIARYEETLYPKASGEETELIYCFNTFDINRLKVDIEVKADRFNQDIVDDISHTLGTAA